MSDQNKTNRQPADDTDRLEKEAQKTFNERIQREAPTTRRQLAEQLEKFLSWLLRDKSIKADLSIWKNDILMVYSSEKNVRLFLTENNYVKFWGFKIVSVESIEEMPDDAPWAIDTTKPDDNLHKQCLGAFGQGDYMSLTSDLQQFLNFYFNENKDRTFQVAYGLKTNRIEVSCSRKEDTAWINRSRKHFYGAPIHAKYDENLTLELDEAEGG